MVTYDNSTNNPFLTVAHAKNEREWSIQKIKLALP